MNLKSLSTPRWYLRSGATAEEVEHVEMALGVRFPLEYRDLIAWTNGADFQIGTVYFRLLSLREVVSTNEALRVQEYIPATVAIGNDGGDRLYLLDYRSDAERPALVEVDAGSLCLADVIVHGSSLDAAFLSWSGIDAARVQLLGCLAARTSKT